ncbi:fused MFS/spermidine synthase [Saccharothrix violaceirubra]
MTEQVLFGRADLIPDRTRPTGWTVAVDGVSQSYVDTLDPTFLRVPYTRWMGALIDHHWPAGPVDAVHVGGGALTLPRYVGATRPGSRQTVFELDGPLVEFVSRHLPVPDVEVVVGDGAAGLLTVEGADLVVLDVFRGGAVTTELLTVPYLHEAAPRVAPSGLLLANLWDGPDLTFTGHAVAALDAAFAHVTLFAEAAVFLGSRPGSVVVAASHGPLAAQTWTTTPKAFGLTAPQLTGLRGPKTPLTTTNPVQPSATVQPWPR